MSFLRKESAKKQAAIVVKTPIHPRAWVWLCIAVAWVLLGHAWFAPSSFVYYGLFFCAGRIYLVWRHSQGHIDTRTAAQKNKLIRNITLVLWMITLIAVGLVWLQYRTLLGREAGIAVLTLMVGLKLLESRSQRDAHVLASLLLFMTLAAFMRQENFTALMWSLFSGLFIFAGVVAVNRNAATFDTQPLKEAGKLTAIGIPLAIILFVAFPRVAGPLWGMPSDAAGGKTGLSDSITLGKFADLAISEETAFRVKFEVKTPAEAQLYWRGPVLTEFDGTRWSATDYAAVTRTAEKSSLSLPNVALNKTGLVNEQFNDTIYDYTIYYEPHKYPYRVLLEYALNAPVGTTLNPDGVAYADVLSERSNLKAQATPQAQLGIAANKRALQRALALPAGRNPRTQTYANELLQKTNPKATRDAILTVLQHFRDQNFSYSLSPSDLTGGAKDTLTPLQIENAIDTFLFDTRTGYCEHYATAFVVIMRNMGLPARVIMGYQGGEINAIDGQMTVRQSDAHAWAEVWDDATQTWLRVDPTSAVAPWRVQAGASQRLSAAAAKQNRTVLGNFLSQSAGFISPDLAQSLLKMRAQLEASSAFLQDKFGYWVQGYGGQRQRELFGKLGFPEVNAANVMTVLGGAAGVWILLALWYFRNRKPKPTETQTLLLAFDAFILKRNLPARESSQTPAAWVAQNVQAPSEVLQLWLRDYEVAIYASEPASGQFEPKVIATLTRRLKMLAIR